MPLNITGVQIQSPVPCLVGNARKLSWASNVCFGLPSRLQALGGCFGFADPECRSSISWNTVVPISQ